MQDIISITDGVARNPVYRMKKPINLHIGKGEHIAIVGPNGGGKSLLVDTITGRYPLLMNEVAYDFSPSESEMVCDNVKYITFRDSYGDSDATYYYQQRWNTHDIDETPIVRDLLPACADGELKDALYDLFGVEAMLDKHIILLSSGELRKFQLTKTLLSGPRVLIMDNPFIGLDAKTRDLLHVLLRRLTEMTRLQVILVLSKTDDIPEFITHVIPVEDRTCGDKISLQEYLHQRREVPAHVLPEEKRERILNLPYGENLYHAEHIVDLNKVSIRYGDRTILKDLDWTVRCGEKWALSGDNGSGKSTLLSLVCADNPQSYACDIALFGRKRGSGESIWEIKKHIGYVSPEMHRAYLKNLPAIDIVASGLHDSIGLYRKMQEKDRAVCEWWMDIFGIADLKDRNFLQLSSGEQRMVLLARAFVKDPELLILDEPLHGLDMWNRRLVKDVIEAFCERKDKTMIMVTHYQEELPAVITNALYLKRN
ncbi:MULTISPECIES: ATP-binding cassette domain-containing protein [Bacteroides]|uniref:ATP-binding cassette domain-containing protein n=1 Tax=Bacteroides gallinaceum TaxID=1462571 RepID=A0ABT7VDI5_9BACE|nr:MULTISPECIES: ATP-binding cassette domain-containing protein [Bacteroides]MCR8917566.1 ATP-binding cassette domain-containing protein [Bacteroides sp. ET225]MDM8324350.1 ATP-binding cassette domain-containing protein [Bacteroides gallinaceum]